MLGPPENVGTQRWSLLFDRLVFWFVCLILPGWSHSLTHKGPSEKSRATKHSIWLHHSLQWPWARSQFTRSFKGPNVRVVNRFKLEKCAWVCVHQGVFSFCTSWGHRSVWVTTWIIVSSRVPGEDAEPTALSQLAGPCPANPAILPTIVPSSCPSETALTQDTTISHQPLARTLTHDVFLHASWKGH